MSAIRPVWRPSVCDLRSYLFPSRNQLSIRHITSQSIRARPSPICQFQSKRKQLLSTTSILSTSNKTSSYDRGPTSSEDTQTDFGAMDVLGNTPAPSTSIDACLFDGFHLDSGVKIIDGKGVLLVAGEAFSWKPWESGKRGLHLVNEKGQWDVEDEAWGLLSLLWPKPDLLILGLGKEMRPISPRTRQHINSLGIRVDIQDTRNAAAQFNLLATERGVGSVAAALIPIGWREGRGCV